jgi:hypothetical protein
MVSLSLSKLKSRFSKEERQKRLESRLNTKLGKEKGKYEKYLAHSEEDKRINKLKSELESYKTMQGVKKRKVKIGGHTFSI